MDVYPRDFNSDGPFIMLSKKSLICRSYGDHFSLPRNMFNFWSNIVRAVLCYQFVKKYHWYGLFKN